MNNAQRPGQNGQRPQLDIRPGGGRRGPAMVAEKPKHFRKTVKRLLSYIGKKRNILIVMIVCVMLSVGVTLVAPIMQTEALNYLTIESAGGYMQIIDGIPRILLNGKVYFFNGVLDQGYFSDGIYTPASPNEYARDILAMKSLGFNTLRKHIKVEPEEFYYQCDKLGMIVFQDMVNNGKYSFLRDTALPTIGFKNLREKKRTPRERDAFYEGMKRTVSQLYSHPCVVYYTIFNEGWGQFEADKMYALMRELDSTRIIDTTSGWFKKNESDVNSLHVYFKEVKLKGEKGEKPIILSEFGGYSYKIKEHSANLKKTYGYKKFENQGEFENALINLYENEVIPNVQNGLCGAIYTQLSDVEDETNGFLTYDRRVLKVNCERVRATMEKLNK